MFDYQSSVLMYSPQPPAEAGQALSALQAGSFPKIAHRAIYKRSALQRGAKRPHPLLLLERESRLRDRRSQRGKGGIAVNLRIVLKIRRLEKVSPPFEGG